MFFTLIHFRFFCVDVISMQLCLFPRHIVAIPAVGILVPLCKSQSSDLPCTCAGGKTKSMDLNNVTVFASDIGATYCQAPNRSLTVSSSSWSVYNRLDQTLATCNNEMVKQIIFRINVPPYFLTHAELFCVFRRPPCRSNQYRFFLYKTAKSREWLVLIVYFYFLSLTCDTCCPSNRG